MNTLAALQAIPQTGITIVSNIGKNVEISVPTLVRWDYLKKKKNKFG